MAEQNTESKKVETENVAPSSAPPAEAEQEDLPVAEVAETEEVELDAALLQSELQALQAKADEYLDGWQRARAEFANYKKRMEREQSLVYQTASGNVIRRFLDISDDLERALKNRPAEGEGAAWSEGIELIYRKMLALLEAEGVTRMKADGQFFDPNLHEAIMQEENSDFESGQIIEVVKQGYWIGDRILRPAQVRVAR